ncbi:hypothetical protein ANCDUO_07968 [Ancylostoma duodenale]|uniref:Uncharacterized protein n=1 Tax=Ancylostoma duodenale TaxID=51022 RepID=A0A0C2GKK4_9BILA|nr:hypothetical protein ANCDUO_07968 [Ancylostoma duodenale]
MTAHATESAVATPAFVRLLNFLFRRLGLFVADHDKFVLASLYVIVLMWKLAEFLEDAISLDVVPLIRKNPHLREPTTR